MRRDRVHAPSATYRRGSRVFWVGVHRALEGDYGQEIRGARRLVYDASVAHDVAFGAAQSARRTIVAQKISEIVGQG